jgi:hypothetical protein
VKNRTFKPFRIPMPFVNGTIGLGQAVKTVTKALGINTCEACSQRAAFLDRRIVLSQLRKR